MVILVNENDQSVGSMEKMEAHRKGLLHRAFSVFLFNSKGDLLLQQRAIDKYHSGGLWTNTCCSHPFPEEDVTDAAHRRLQEEMGMDVPLRFLFKFHYKAPFENGLTEHEIDHVFIGYSDKRPVINPEEVAGYKYMDMETIRQEIEHKPEKYTAWFRIVFNRLWEEVKSTKKMVL